VITEPAKHDTDDPAICIHSENPHQHDLVKVIKVSTNESDGSDLTSFTLHNNFPGGLFVSMSDNRTFHFYAWADIAGKDLKIRK
jgi:3-phytase